MARNIIRRVRTPAGAAYFGLPIGTIITRDIIEAKRRENKQKGLALPKGAVSVRRSDAEFAGEKPKNTVTKQAKTNAYMEAAKAAMQKPSTPLEGDQKFTLGDNVHMLPENSSVARSKNHPSRIAYVRTQDGKTYRLVDEKIEQLDDVTAAALDDVFQGSDTNPVVNAATNVNEDVYDQKNDPDAAPITNVAALPVGEKLTSKSGKGKYTKTAENKWTDDKGFVRDDATIQKLHDFGSIGVGGNELTDIAEPTPFESLLDPDDDIEDAGDILGSFEEGRKIEFDDGRTFTLRSNDEGDAQWVADDDEDETYFHDEMAEFAPLLTLLPESQDEATDLDDPDPADAPVDAPEDAVAAPGADAGTDDEDAVMKEFTDASKKWAQSYAVDPASPESQAAKAEADAAEKKYSAFMQKKYASKPEEADDVTPENETEAPKDSEKSSATSSVEKDSEKSSAPTTVDTETDAKSEGLSKDETDALVSELLDKPAPEKDASDTSEEEGMAQWEKDLLEEDAAQIAKDEAAKKAPQVGDELKTAEDLAALPNGYKFDMFSPWTNDKVEGFTKVGPDFYQDELNGLWNSDEVMGAGNQLTITETPADGSADVTPKKTDVAPGENIYTDVVLNDLEPLASITADYDEGFESFENTFVKGDDGKWYQVDGNGDPYDADFLIDSYSNVALKSNKASDSDKAEAKGLPNQPEPITADDLPDDLGPALTQTQILGKPDGTKFAVEDLSAGDQYIGTKNGAKMTGPEVEFFITPSSLNIFKVHDLPKKEEKSTAPGAPKKSTYAEFKADDIGTEYFTQWGDTNSKGTAIKVSNDELESGDSIITVDADDFDGSPFTITKKSKTAPVTEPEDPEVPSDEDTFTNPAEVAAKLKDDFEPEWLKGQEAVYLDTQEPITKDTDVDAFPDKTVLKVNGKIGTEFETDEFVFQKQGSAWFNGDYAGPATPGWFDFHKSDEFDVYHPNQLDDYKGIAYAPAKKVSGTKTSKTYADTLVDAAKGVDFEFEEKYGTHVMKASIVDDQLLITVDDVKVDENQIKQAHKFLTQHPGPHVVYALKNLPKGHPLRAKGTINQLRDLAIKRYPLLKPKAATLVLLKEAGLIEDAPIVNPKGKSLLVGKPEITLVTHQGPASGNFSLDDIYDAVGIIDGFDGLIFKSQLMSNLNPIGGLDPAKIVGSDKDKKINKANFLGHLNEVLDASALVPTKEQYKARLEALPAGYPVVTRIGTPYMKDENGTFVNMDPNNSNFERVYTVDELLEEKKSNIFFLGGETLTPDEIAEMDEDDRIVILSPQNPSGTSGVTYRRMPDGQWTRVFETGMNKKDAVKETYPDSYFEGKNSYRILHFTTETDDVVTYDPDTGKEIDPFELEKKNAAKKVAVAKALQNADPMEPQTVTMVTHDEEATEAYELDGLNNNTSLIVTDADGNTDVLVKNDEGTWDEETESVSVAEVKASKPDAMYYVENLEDGKHYTAQVSTSGLHIKFHNTDKDVAWIDNSSDFDNALLNKHKYFMLSEIAPDDLDTIPVGGDFVVRWGENGSNSAHLKHHSDTEWGFAALKTSHVTLADIKTGFSDGVFYRKDHKDYSNWPEKGKTSDEVLAENESVVIDQEPIHDDELGDASISQYESAEYVAAVENDKDAIQPGKYTTKNGKVFMVVKEDGSGTYYDKQGNAKPLTKKAVQKNYDSGMSTLHPDFDPNSDLPENVEVSEADQKSYAKSLTPVGELTLPDGYLYNGTPNTPGNIYEVVDGEVVAQYKPLLKKKANFTDYVVGQATEMYSLNSVSSMDILGEGTTFSWSDDYTGNPLPWNQTVYKGAGGWDVTLQDGSTKEFDTTGSTFVETMKKEFPHATTGSYTDAYVYSYASGTVVQIGPKPDAMKTKPSTKTIQSMAEKGILADKYGNSIVPSGHVGSMLWFGTSTNAVKLKELSNSLSNDADWLSDDWNTFAGSQGYKDFAALGMASGKLLTKWLDDNYPGKIDKTSSLTSSTNFKVTRKALMDALDTYTVNLGDKLPEADTASLFEYNSFNQPKYPSLDPSLWGNKDLYDWYAGQGTAGDYAAFMKEASAKFGGGGIIGLHWNKMDKSTRHDWLVAFQDGNFKQMYNLEMQAAAKEGKPHGSGYLHPGYFSNTDTHQIKWAPAVDGQVAAGKPVEGDWSTDISYASAEEVDNYLIKANAQYGEFMTMNQRRAWYSAHKAGNQKYVNQLSVEAKLKSDNGEAPLTAPLTFTDNVQPGKSYNSMFDTTPHPTNWSGNKAKDYLNDNPELSKELIPDQNQYMAGYQYADALNNHFGKLAQEAYQQSLIPVYTKAEQQTVAQATNPAFDFVDQFDNKYIFKPRNVGAYDDWRTENEHAGNLLGRLFGFQTPQSHVETLEVTPGNERYGQLQHKIKDVVGDLLGADYSTLTQVQLQDIANEHIADWIMDNDDTHGGNALMTASGRIIGIDKGRAFRHYGEWNGLSGDASADSNAALVYTKMYNAIRAGKIDKEVLDKVYQGVMKKTASMQRLPDARVEEVVRITTAKRPALEYTKDQYFIDGKPVSQDADGLVAAVLDRKSKLQADFQTMWAKIYKDAGYGDLPELPDHPLDEVMSGLDDERYMEAVHTNGIYGASTMLANPNVVGGSAFSWTEADVNGKTRTLTELKLDDTAQTELLSTLSTLVGDTPPDSASVFNYDKFYNRIFAAAKTVNHHAADGAYNESTIQQFENATSEIKADLADVPNAYVMTEKKFGQPAHKFPSGNVVSFDQIGQYLLMLEKYDKQVDVIAESKSKQEKTPHVEQWKVLTLKTQDVWKNSNTNQRAVATSDGNYLITGRGTAQIVGGASDEAVAFLTGIDGWYRDEESVSEDGVYAKYKVTLNTKTYERQSEFKDGVKKQTSESVGNTSSIGGSEEVNRGKEYEITLPSGNSIFFRNGTTTATVRSQRGRVTFLNRSTGDSPSTAQSAMDEFRQAMNDFGLELDAADEVDAELIYWRQMHDIVSGHMDHPSDNQKWKQATAAYQKARNDLSATDENFLATLSQQYGKDGELQWHREFWSEYWPTEVQDLIDNNGFLPKYNTYDPNDLEKHAGRPYWYRLDAKEELETIINSNNVLGREFFNGVGSSTVQSKKFLLAVDTNGFLSTEERLRILSSYVGGASPGPDQAHGSANYIFMRTFNPKEAHDKGRIVYVMRPQLALKTTSYAFDGDKYGEIDKKGSAAPKSASVPFTKWAGNHSSNETLSADNATWSDDIELLVMDSESVRDTVIQEMKKRGFATIRGLPIEDRIIMRSSLQDALAKIRETWKEFDPWA